MKKIISVTVIMCAIVALSLTGCSGKPEYNYAFITVGDNIVEGFVTEWYAFGSGLGVVVDFTDGRRYRTSLENVVLVYDDTLITSGEGAYTPQYWSWP